MSSLDRWLLVVEWSLTLVAAIAFLVLYGWPGRYRDRTMAWHVFSVTTVAGLESAGLLAAALRHGLPMWFYALVYGAGAAIVVWRLVLLVSNRKEAP